MVEKNARVDFVKNHWVFIVTVAGMVLVFAGVSGGLSNLFNYEFGFSGDPLGSDARPVSDLVSDAVPVFSGSKVPEYLFDISFRLDDSSIEDASSLSSIVTLENFGSVSTTIKLSFGVLDENGKNIYRDSVFFEVSVEEVLLWNYDELTSLPDGKYTAILETVYGSNIRDEFSQDFEIDSSSGFFG